MSHLSSRTTLAFACLAAAAMPIQAAAAAAPPVTVRVYDAAGGDAAMRHAAMREAAAILNQAGAGTTWQDCTAGPEPRRCTLSRGPRDLLVRIMPAFVQTTTGMENALQTRLGEDRLMLGFAVVDPARDAGVLATIFMDRVLALALRTGVPATVVLGRAFAHEVGHLLLGNRGHSTTGLMRGLWTDAELAAGKSEDWLFAPAERDLLRTRHAGLTTPRAQ